MLALLFLLAAPPEASGCRLGPGEALYGLPVRALTADWKELEGVRTEDFTLTVNRAKVAVCGFSHSRQPVSMGILLDTSGSMGAQKWWPSAVRAAVERMLDDSVPGDEYFLDFINAKPEVRGDFTADVNRIRNGLEFLTKGQTAAVDAIRSGLAAMSRARYANRILLVVSDTADNASRSTQKELDKAFSAAPVPAFLLRPERIPRRGELRGMTAEELDPAAPVLQRTGGFAKIAVTRDDFVETGRLFAYLAHSPYLLYFVAPAVPPERFEVRAETPGIAPKPHLMFRAALKHLR